MTAWVPKKDHEGVQTQDEIVKAKGKDNFGLLDNNMKIGITSKEKCAIM